jgi:hypothetical protein
MPRRAAAPPGAGDYGSAALVRSRSYSISWKPDSSNLRAIGCPMNPMPINPSLSFSWVIAFLARRLWSEPRIRSRPSLRWKAGKEDAASSVGDLAPGSRGFSIEPLGTVNLLEIRYYSRRPSRATESHAFIDQCLAASGESATASNQLLPMHWCAVAASQYS